MRATPRPVATLTLQQATAIATAAIAEARQLNLAPLSVAVLDAAGTIKTLQTEDRVALMRPNIAVAKAWGCLGLGFSTRGVTTMAEEMGPLFDTFRGLADGRLVPSPGGVLLVNGDKIVGAVGVSGDTGNNDEKCALAGIEATELAGQL